MAVRPTAGPPSGSVQTATKALAVVIIRRHPSDHVPQIPGLALASGVDNHVVGTPLRIGLPRRLVALRDTGW